MFIGKDSHNFKVKDLVQLLNPKSKRYVLIDRKNGRILAHKSDKEPYKGIKVISGYASYRNKSTEECSRLNIKGKESLLRGIEDVKHGRVHGIKLEDL